MNIPVVNPIRKPIIAALACAAFLFAQGWIATASAAEWQTWPRPKAPAPRTTPVQPPASAAAAKAGEAAGKKTAGGIKAGTVAKAALIAAGIAGIAIAIGGGGGGGGTTSNH